MSEPSILVLDDNPEHLKLVVHYLRAKGFAVRAATNTREADAALDEERPALVLLDVALPGEDGLSWVQRRRRVEQGAGLSEVQFVALTAHGDPDVQERASEAGCIAFFNKPVSLKGLVETVQDLVKQSVWPG